MLLIVCITVSKVEYSAVHTILECREGRSLLECDYCN